MLTCLTIDIAFFLCRPTEYIVTAYHSSSDTLELVDVSIDAIINELLDPDLLYLDRIEPLLLVKRHQAKDLVPLIIDNCVLKLLQELLDILLVLVAVPLCRLVLQVIHYFQVHLLDLRLSVSLFVEILRDHLLFKVFGFHVF